MLCSDVRNHGRAMKTSIRISCSALIYLDLHNKSVFNISVYIEIFGFVTAMKIVKCTF